MEKVKVNAYCGFNKELKGLFQEPGECCWNDTVELDGIDWEDGCVSMICPSCGAELTQDMDHFELIS